MKNIRTAALLAAFLAISPPLFPADAAPKPLFAADLSNAEFSPGSWAWENGVLAGKGLGNIWTRETYGDFDLSLEFRCSEKTDAGVFLRCSDINDPAHSTFEVQIAGGSRNASRATGAIYGCLAPSRQIKTEPGKWYQYIIQARGRRITVRFDGGQIIDMDLAKWKTFRKNPDGSGNMLSKAGKDMATKGRLGLQSHAGKVEFRNISVSALASAPVAAEPDGDSVPSWARETGKQKEERMAWWTHDRFGMFIHWGAYALAARHEQVKGKEKISDADYQKYFDYFNPDLYNPKEWAARAKAAGMKYVVITTKHHEGFCLWDTKHTDFKVTNTPYGKDLIRPFVDAFRAEGIRIGFYYSMIDWHHPDFTFDRVHPNGPKDPAERKAANEKRDMGKYRQYMKNQVTELLTEFGQIDELFMDWSYPGENGKGFEDWDSEGLLKLIRQLQPQILVNNRLDLRHTDWGWDFATPEQFLPQTWLMVRGKKVPWETCQTFSGSWGYYRDEHTWKSTRQLLVMLVEVVSKGGNLLLNVGPTARGTFDERAGERLAGIEKWMKLHDRSIYGCTQAPEGFQTPRNCLLTYNPETKRLYIHVLEWPIRSLLLPGYAGKFKYAQLLNDASEIKFQIPKEHGHYTTGIKADDIVLTLPVGHPAVEVPVIELVLE